MPLLKIPACTYWTFEDNPNRYVFRGKSDRIILVKAPQGSSSLHRSFKKTDFHLIPYAGAIDPLWQKVEAEDG